MSKVEQKSVRGSVSEVDTDGIDELFEELAEQPNWAPVTPIKIRLEPFGGVPSYRLVSELVRRHYKVVLTALFWAAVGALVVIAGRR